MSRLAVLFAAPAVLALMLTAVGAVAGPVTARTPSPPLVAPTLGRGIAPATTYVLQAPVAVDNPGTADDTYTVFSTPMAVWYVNGVLVDPATLDKRGVGRGRPIAWTHRMSTT